MESVIFASQILRLMAACVMVCTVIWQPETATKYLLQDGDLLFARSGATVGKAFLYHSYMGSACFAGYLIRARVNTDKLVPRFLRYYS